MTGRLLLHTWLRNLDSCHNLLLKTGNASSIFSSASERIRIFLRLFRTLRGQRQRRRHVYRRTRQFSVSRRVRYHWRHITEFPVFRRWSFLPIRTQKREFYWWRSRLWLATKKSKTNHSFSGGSTLYFADSLLRPDYYYLRRFHTTHIL